MQSYTRSFYKLFLFSISLPEAAETGAKQGWAREAAGGEGRRVPPTAGAAGEEKGGGPAERQGVSVRTAT